MKSFPLEDYQSGTKHNAAVVAQTSPSFMQLVIVGLGLSILGAIVFPSVLVVFDFSSAAMLSMTGLAIGYVTALCLTTGQKTGWLTTHICQLALFFLGLGLAMPLEWYAALNILTVWLFRSCGLYRSPLSAVIDLTLIGFSCVVALFTFHETSSLLMSLWAFFLMQALIAWIPISFSNELPAQRHTQSHFDRAAQHAEHALTLVRASH